MNSFIPILLLWFFDGSLHLRGKVENIRGFVSCGTEGWGGLTERRFMIYTMAY